MAPTAGMTISLSQGLALRAESMIRCFIVTPLSMVVGFIIKIYGRHLARFPSMKCRETDSGNNMRAAHYIEPKANATTRRSCAWHADDATSSTACCATARSTNQAEPTPPQRQHREPRQSPHTPPTTTRHDTSRNQTHLTNYIGTPTPPTTPPQRGRRAASVP